MVYLKSRENVTMSDEDTVNEERYFLWDTEQKGDLKVIKKKVCVCVKNREPRLTRLDRAASSCRRGT